MCLVVVTRVLPSSLFLRSSCRVLSPLLLSMAGVGAAVVAAVVAGGGDDALGEAGDTAFTR